jgi:4-aminobutyrate aminotransferase-like enzyme
MKACHECVGTNGMINVRGIGLMIGIEFDNKKEEIRKFDSLDYVNQIKTNLLTAIFATIGPI